MIKNVFFDRDGTIVVDKHYLRDAAGLELIPGAGLALGRLAASGCKLFLVSNQSGVGRGFFPESACIECQHRLAELLRPYDANFLGMAYCPHAPEDCCNCRKPGLGMWRTLQQNHRLDPAACVMIGDKKEDIGFGLAAGFAACILVLTGHGRSQAELLGLPPLPPDRSWTIFDDSAAGWPHILARDVVAAADWILCSERLSPDQPR